MLEIGPGAGHFLHEARIAGYAVAGVERSPAMAEHARRQAGVPVLCARFEDSDPPAAAVDVACAWRTLEYAPDPRRFLDAVHAVLTPGGMLALESWNAHLREPAAMLGAAAQLPGEPPRLYLTPTAVKVALERSGFEVIGCETIYSEAYEGSNAKGTLGRFSRRDLVHPSRGEFIRAVARRP